MVCASSVRVRIAFKKIYGKKEHQYYHLFGGVAAARKTRTATRRSAGEPEGVTLEERNNYFIGKSTSQNSSIEFVFDSLKRSLAAETID